MFCRDYRINTCGVLVEYTLQWKQCQKRYSPYKWKHLISTIEKYVSTQRTDRTGIERGDLPQGNLVDLEMSMNFQAIINISKKRCCMCASKETREVWRAVLDAIKEYEPELVSVCVPDCLYRGFCAEMFSCGYSKSDDFNNKLEQYRGGVKFEN